MADQLGHARRFRFVQVINRSFRAAVDTVCAASHTRGLSKAFTLALMLALAVAGSGLIKAGSALAQNALVTDEPDPAERAGAPDQHEALRGEAAASARRLDALSTEELAAYARIRRVLRDYDLEADAWRRAAALAPDRPGFWLEMGRAYYALGEDFASEAQRAFRTCIDRSDDPGVTADAANGLGYLYYRAGLYDLAGAHFDQALAHDANHVNSRLGQAALAIRAGDLAEAADALDSLMNEVTPEAGRAFQSVLNEAVRAFDRSRLWFSGTAANHLAYAKLLLRTQRAPEAIAPLRRSVELDPSSVFAWNLLGSLYRQTGQFADARDAFERSLALNPSQPRTREALEAVISEMTPPDTQAPDTPEPSDAPEAPEAPPQPLAPRLPGISPEPAG